MTSTGLPSKLRGGVATAEFAVTFPLLFFILAGIWEVGRMVEVQQVIWNSAREAARQASTSEDNMNKITYNTVMYIQRAEPSVFRYPNASTLVPIYATAGDPTTLITGAKVMDGVTELSTLTFSKNIPTDQQAAPPNPEPTNVCWMGVYDNSASLWLMHLQFTDFVTSHPTISPSPDPIDDPSEMVQLDHFQMAVWIPYGNVKLSTLAQITPKTWLYGSADWYCLRDTPININPVLPAQ